MRESFWRLPRIRQVRATDLWIVGLPVAVIAVLSSYLIAKIFILFSVQPNTSEVLALFQAELTPKPEQQLRYILLLLFWPFLFLAGVSVKNHWKKWARPFLVMTSVALPLFLVINLIYQEAVVHAFFMTKSDTLGYSVLAFVAALAITYWVLKSAVFSVKKTVVIALGVSLLELMVCIVTEGNYLGSAVGTGTHLPFTFDEFAAVVNGHTLAVDYFSQYQQFLPYLLSPIFHVFGLSITTYTASLLVLSASVLGLVFIILKKVTSRPEVALLLFISWLGIAFYPIELNGDSRYLTFTYFPMGPLRYFGFWLVAYLTLRTVTGPASFRREYICAGISALSAINTLDFGFPAMVGCIFVLLTFSHQPKKTGIAIIAGVTTAVGIYLGNSFLRSGHLPDYSAITSYILAVSRVGYTSIITRSLGIHWIFILGLLMSLILGIQFRWNEKRSGVALSSRRRSLAAILTFMGIAGSGVFAYFMNRSHWHVLIVSAPIVAFPLFIFTAMFFEKRVVPFPFPKLYLAPKIFLLLFVIYGLSLHKNFPNPISQWNRITMVDDYFSNSMTTLAERIRMYASPGESVGICYPFGQLIAHRAQVTNIFPYPQALSLVLKSQILRVEEIFQKNTPKFLFGNFPVELLPWMNENGFIEVERVNDFTIYRRGEVRK